MGNGQDIAARSSIETTLGEPLPERVIVGGIDVADRVAQNDVVAEDYIAVQVRAGPEGAVLVGDEGGVFAGCVPTRGRFLGDLLPAKALGGAVHVVVAASFAVVSGPGRNDGEDQLPGVRADTCAHGLARVAHVSD